MNNPINQTQAPAAEYTAPSRFTLPKALQAPILALTSLVALGSLTNADAQTRGSRDDSRQYSPQQAYTERLKQQTEYLKARNKAVQAVERAILSGMPNANRDARRIAEISAAARVPLGLSKEQYASITEQATAVQKENRARASAERAHQRELEKALRIRRR